jgi:hypothetical protein
MATPCWCLNRKDSNYSAAWALLSIAGFARLKNIFASVENAKRFQHSLLSLSRLPKGALQSIRKSGEIVGSKMRRRRIFEPTPLIYEMIQEKFVMMVLFSLQKKVPSFTPKIRAISYSPG